MGPRPLPCEPGAMVAGYFLAATRTQLPRSITATAQRALRASNASYTLLWRLVEGSVALEAQRELEDR